MGKTCLRYWTLINLSTQMNRTAAQIHYNSRKLKFPCRIRDNVQFPKVRHHLECVNREVQTSASLVLHWGSLFLIPKQNILLIIVISLTFPNSLLIDYITFHSAVALCVFSLYPEHQFNSRGGNKRVNLWNKSCKAFGLLGMPIPLKRFFKAN